MRVALLSNTADPRDGYGNITVELSKALHAAGVECELFLPRAQSTAASEASFPFPVHCTLPPYVYRIYQPAGLRYFLPQRWKGFDLIHSLFGFPYSTVAALASLRSGTPFVMGAQGTHGVRPLTWYPERWLLNWCYSRARGIAVPSVYTKNKILEHAGKPFTIDIIHNGVHVARFQKDPGSDQIRKKYEGKRILLTVGGLWGRKGQDLVIRTLPAVLRAHPNTVYVMVGDGNARADLEQLANELGVRHAVDFAGRKSGDDLVAYFHACDLYVHTPRMTDLKFEGFGIVYLEASACGKPIVATDSGGIRDAVLDNETGLITAEEDVHGVTGSILRLLSDSVLANKLGSQGRAYAQKHDWAQIAEQYVQWYTESLNRK